jgi:serine/threonine-protein kinase
MPPSINPCPAPASSGCTLRSRIPPKRPNIGEHDDKPFISFEYVEGGSLARRIAEQPVSIRRAARVAHELAVAVHYAHERGIIHRDLKPANVLLTEDGQAKIVDFGLAKYREAESGQTKTGDIMGTPSYMAPEQAMGRSKAVGPATDVYAIGAVLYELLTGRPPFAAATPVDTLLQVMEKEPVPLRELNAEVTRDLETICLKCLQKEPGQRYAGADALADDLRRFLDDEPIKARPPGWLARANRWIGGHQALGLFYLMAASALVVHLMYYGLVRQRIFALETVSSAAVLAVVLPLVLVVLAAFVQARFWAIAVTSLPLALAAVLWWLLGAPAWFGLFGVLTVIFLAGTLVGLTVANWRLTLIVMLPLLTIS